MLNSVLSWTWIGSGLLLIILVLLHSPKGDGMGGLAASGSSMFSSAVLTQAGTGHHLTQQIVEGLGWEGHRHR